MDPINFSCGLLACFCRSEMEKLKFLPQGKLGTQFSFQASPFLMFVPPMSATRFVFEFRRCFSLPFSQCIIGGEYKWNNLTFKTRYCCGYIIEANYHDANWSWLVVKKALDGFTYVFSFVHDTNFFFLIANK